MDEEDERGALKSSLIYVRNGRTKNRLMCVRIPATQILFADDMSCSVVRDHYGGMKKFRIALSLLSLATPSFAVVTVLTGFFLIFFFILEPIQQS